LLHIDRGARTVKEKTLSECAGHCVQFKSIEFRANRTMLRTALPCAVVMACASAAYAVNPSAESASALVLHSTLDSVTGEISGIAAPIAEVKPGQTFTITGDCVARVNSADNLRVVLTFADTANDTPGYRSMIATDQEIGAGGLSVRVPDLPEATNRVFSVKVFHLGHEAPEICNAGTIRIGAAPEGKIG
jgi:hypothetical protein